MTKLFLVRHGETVLNEKKVYYGSTDCALNEVGVQQGEKLKNVLKDVHFDVVIASPLQRAMDSASILTDVPKAKIKTDERLQEIEFGLWEGRTYDEIQTDDPKNWEEWCNDWIYKAPPKGESFDQFYHRVKECFIEILEKYQNKTILLVSHQGCMRIILTILLHLDKESYWNFTFENGTYSLVEIVDGHSTIKKINCEVYP